MKTPCVIGCTATPGTSPRQGTCLTSRAGFWVRVGCDLPTLKVNPNCRRAILAGSLNSHLRSADKPHSVQRTVRVYNAFTRGQMRIRPLRAPGRTSVWDACHHAPRAAYPGLWRDGRRETSSFPAGRTAALPLLGLAPGGGCLAARIAADAGGLLHHLFTLAGAYSGSLFLWPNPAGCPAPGVTRHHALWSADFPRCQPFRAAPRPPGRPEML